ncbi:putative receptor-like protein kinase [Cinnamomum micranthum f. kanehirae]|uniref:RING-type E3 ubiquitin transferase n=1 Tax=Cinnamomum micranthum f. kanehirae TaxID=337451 RepID=A0A3S3PLS6_9MAGN|nr:putative receptor-like protein kinase [Cinnamomum micranthum f. kanehirae]
MGSLEQSIFFLLPLSFMIVSSLSHADSCKPDRCSWDGPLIRFPFRINDTRRQLERCGYPGFDLFCKDNHTYIHFPYLESRYVLVERIDYKKQILTIADHKNCLWGLLFNSPNFPASIEYQYAHTIHTLVNCSKNVDFDYYFGSWIPCLSDAEHDAFVDSSDEDVDSSNTVGLLPDLHDLMWYVPGCIGCERSKGMECRYKDDNSNDTLCSPTRRKGWLADNVIIVTCIGSFLLLTTLVVTISSSGLGTQIESWILKTKSRLTNF